MSKWFQASPVVRRLQNLVEQTSHGLLIFKATKVNKQPGDSTKFDILCPKILQPNGDNGMLSEIQKLHLLWYKI